MRHPEHAAQLLRPRSAWRDHSERGSRDHDALDWRDSLLALAGCSGIAYEAFMFRYSEEPPGAALVAHLLGVARAAIGSSDQVTPEQLVELLLREERAPESQRTERHRTLALGVSAAFYARRVARPYATVAAALESLSADAWRCARARIDEAA